MRGPELISDRPGTMAAKFAKLRPWSLSRNLPLKAVTLMGTSCRRSSRFSAVTAMVSSASASLPEDLFAVCAALCRQGTSAATAIRPIIAILVESFMTSPFPP